MIISPRYRYLFIEIPLTGSWAIRNELCNYYDGSEILHKHATYPDFQQIATDDEKKYFVFATVRNPLDGAVSGFFKLKSDHKGVFSDARSSVDSFTIDYSELDAYMIIQETDSSFKSFFMRSKIWNRVYSGMIDVSADNLDYVIRFERFNEGFTEVLRLLGIEQVRIVPVSNKTKQRKANWVTYFTPNMIPKAEKKYGPFMNRWGYDFPSDWARYHTSRIKETEYVLSVAIKKIYLTRIRYNNAGYAKIIRRLHAKMKRFVYT